MVKELGKVMVVGVVGLVVGVVVIRHQTMVGMRPTKVGLLPTKAKVKERKVRTKARSDGLLMRKCVNHLVAFPHRCGKLMLARMLLEPC